MKQVDRWLQQWRIAKALPFLERGARVLDIGCGEGELLRRVTGLADGSIGVDPTLLQAAHRGAFRLVRGIFPDDVPANAGPFDAIVSNPPLLIPRATRFAGDVYLSATRYSAAA